MNAHANGDEFYLYLYTWDESLALAVPHYNTPELWAAATAASTADAVSLCMAATLMRQVDASEDNSC